jgi:four helix bundle protein
MNAYQFSFEKLEVWQLARKLLISVYRLTEHFPPEEKYSMVSQMRRASLSVCSNLAEGSSRQTARDQSRFTTIAFSSMLELLNQLILSTDLGYLTTVELTQFRKDISVLTVKLINLKKSQEDRLKS